MKKALTMASLLSLIALPVWGGGVGVMVSTWDTDGANDDQGGGVKVKFDVGSAVDFELRATWFDSLEFATASDEFKLEIVPLDLGLSYDFRKGHSVKPFVGGGLTYAFVNGKVHSDAAIQVDDEAGFYVVGGLDGSINERFTIFAEAIYRDLTSEVTSDGFLNRDFEDFQVDLGGAGFNAGLMLSW